jgi:ATP phosphoribosyltransferase regulatory subunit
LEKICPDEIFRQKVIGCIKSKNPHDLSRICREYGVEDTQLVQLVSAYGPRDKVLEKLEALDCGREALQELQALSRLLDQLPWGDQIIFDFSVVNNMNYYNGIVFQGFLSGIFESVLAGGQYDKLMQKLERRSGAVGFAVYLDLLEQLPAEDAQFDVDVLLIYDGDADKMAVAKAVARLTAQGKTVSTQKSIPEKLRYRALMKLTKEGTVC